MFDVNKINNELSGLVGWKQPPDPDSPIVDANNLLSSSGRYFNDNNFITLKQLKETQNYIGISDEQFNDFLRDIYRQSLVNVLDSIFNESDFIDRQLLYKHTNNKTSTDVLPTGFVGYQINPSLANNISFEITRAILEFDNTGSEITLLLYNSSEPQPLFSETITVTSSNQEVPLGWYLNSTNGVYRGEYFFGYRTDGVTLQPFKRGFESSDLRACIDGIYTIPVRAPQATSALFDLETVENVTETWGLNPDFSTYRDYTDLITQNKRLFAPAVQLQGQIKVMEVYLSSPRSNRLERISNDNFENVMVELEGVQTGSFGKRGLRSLLSEEILKAKQEINKMLNNYSDQNYITSVTRC